MPGGGGKENPTNENQDAHGRPIGGGRTSNTTTGTGTDRNK